MGAWLVVQVTVPEDLGGGLGLGEEVGEFKHKDLEEISWTASYKLVTCWESIRILSDRFLLEASTASLTTRAIGDSSGDPIETSLVPKFCETKETIFFERVLLLLSTTGMGDWVAWAIKLAIRKKIGWDWSIIEAGSTTRSVEMIAISQRTLLYSRVNSSGEPLTRSWNKEGWYEGEEEREEKDWA